VEQVVFNVSVLALLQRLFAGCANRSVERKIKTKRAAVCVVALSMVYQDFGICS
jgi:hypothetical protein